MSEPSWQGYVDCVVDGIVTGWAWNPGRPGEPVTVEILRGDEPVAVTVADAFRPDLLEDRVGDGRHGFKLDLMPLQLGAGEYLNARIRGAPFELSRSPFTFVPPPRFSESLAPTEDPAALQELESYSRAWAARAHRENKRLNERERLAGATLLSSFPQKVQIETTKRCNYKCVMCPHAYGLMSGAKHLDVALIAHGMPFVAHAHRIQLFGTGEPLMSPAFWEIIEALDPGGPAGISVNTNGTLLNSERIDRILRSALTSISISLDAARPETYAKIRGGDFHSVIRKVGALIERRNAHSPRRLNVYINIALMKENIGEFRQFVELGAELGVDKIEVCHLLDFEEHSAWKLKRGDWEFHYGDQLLKKDPGKAGDCIAGALERSRELGIPVSFDGSQFEDSTPIFNGRPS